MTNVIDQILESNYHVTEAEVEALAAMHMDANNTQGIADGSYLKILLAGCQATLGKSKRKIPNMVEAHSTVLDDVHIRYYNAVLRGVTSEDIQIDDSLDQEEQRRRRVEQLRRATFARSAKSTLQAYISALGDIRTLDVASTSKAGLRKYVNEASGAPSWEQSIASNRNKIEKICRRLAETNPGEAREILESVLSHIQDVLDSITGTDRRGQESVMVFTADVPSIVEIPEDYGEGNGASAVDYMEALPTQQPEEHRSHGF